MIFELMSATSFVCISSCETLKVTSGTFIHSPPGPPGAAGTKSPAAVFPHTTPAVCQIDATEDLCF